MPSDRHENPTDRPPRRGGAFDPPDGSAASATDAGGLVSESNLADAGANHPGYMPPPPDEPMQPRRSLVAGAIYDTFGRTGARVALAWIGLLAAVAALAPFLANSRPYVARWADGTTTYPLFDALTWVDVTLLVALLAAVVGIIATRFVPARRRGRFGRWAALAGLLLVAVTAPVAGNLLNPPTLEQYDRFRAADRDETLTSAVYAPVAYSPNDANRDDPDRTRPQQPPSAKHWLGTTIYGESLLSRVIFAARVALAIGFISTGIAAVIGVAVGAVMGYFAGWVDLLLMRCVEIVEAVPRIVLLMIVVTFFSEGQFLGVELKDARLYLMMVTIGLVSWTSDARFIRAEFLKLRKQDFVQACVATGLPLRNLLFRHMLPNGVAPVLVNVSFGIAGAILLESVLSFLGLGLEADQPSWGQLLAQATQGGSGFNWWIATFPGLAIFLTVFAYILIGEALRDALDPKSATRD